MFMLAWEFQLELPECCLVQRALGKAWLAKNLKTWARLAQTPGVAEIPASHKQTALVPVGQVPGELAPVVHKETISLLVRPEKLQLVRSLQIPVHKVLARNLPQRTVLPGNAIEPAVVKKILKLMR
jgi:hypothetical protein